MRIDRYDACLLGGDERSSVEWWRDYMRTELDNAHDFYAAQLEMVNDEIRELKKRMGKAEDMANDLRHFLGA